jgi:glycine oxidase
VNASTAPTAEHGRLDVIIIGDGIIGLSVALELARRGARGMVFGAARPGVASFASAGVLAPSVGRLPPAARPFFVDSLASYPAFLEALNGDADPITAITTIDGLIELAPDANSGQPLDAGDLAALEPAIAYPGAARFHPRDGAVDNVLLTEALRRALGRVGAFASILNPVVSLDFDVNGATVVTESGHLWRAGTVVLAAGAWAPALAGLPRPLPVVPLKGQILALGDSPLSHPAMADDVYLVPRRGETLAGATIEAAGFDTSTSADAERSLLSAAIRVCPVLAAAAVTHIWAGIRPATPDMLPILGRDPEVPSLIYACGHSKNGILLAPATAAGIAALVEGAAPPVDLAPFSIGRFIQ